jgi:hypothetical protein
LTWHSHGFSVDEGLSSSFFLSKTFLHIIDDERDQIN